METEKKEDRETYRKTQRQRDTERWRQGDRQKGKTERGREKEQKGGLAIKSQGPAPMIHFLQASLHLLTVP